MADKLSTLLKKHIMPTTSVKEAAGEIRELTPADKAWYARQFISEGYSECVEYNLPDGTTVTVP